LMPELIRLPLPDSDALGQASASLIQNRLESGKYNTIVIGPGLGSEPKTFTALQTLLQHFKTLEIPVVVDADGLNALSRSPMELNSRFLLTPHLGEASRLLHQEKAGAQQNLIQTVQELRRRYHAQVVLKTASTVVATAAFPPQEELLWISPTGNPGMATAGSGDVLTGIIGAIAAQTQAQNLPIWQAATLGVFLHGLAGDTAVVTRTPYAMRASDITRSLPQAFQQVLAP
jgi:ADP-dependent NAD(P)H-hydrate dehydratase / NAD(P)H-hydrate epimerase